MQTLRHLSFSFLVAAMSLSHAVSGWSTCYQREMSVIGSDFFEQFDWFTEDDPTHGRVNYLSLEESKAKNLAYATEDKFFMFPDSKNKVKSGARGRDSNRISSKRTFDESVVILDLQHMPYGCGTWPAFWSYSQTELWPTGGEVDVIEGYNVNRQNKVSLHTLPNCTMPQTRLQTGTTASTNCDSNFNFNEGCGTQVPSSLSYGQGFNSNGGGFYALERNKDDGIKVWFWPRSGPVPLDVSCNEDTVDPGAWGIPVAYFPTGKNCSYKKHFGANMLVFDLTFCGDLAGNTDVWKSSGCSAMTCNDFVDKTPQAFADAYWEVNSLRVYLPKDD